MFALVAKLISLSLSMWLCTPPSTPCLLSWLGKRFFVVMLVMTLVSSSIGASLAALLLSNGVYVNGSSLGNVWIEWFVGNVSTSMMPATRFNHNL